MIINALASNAHATIDGISSVVSLTSWLLLSAPSGEAIRANAHRGMDVGYFIMPLGGGKFNFRAILGSAGALTDRASLASLGAVPFEVGAP